MALRRLKGLAGRVKRRIVGSNAIGDQLGPAQDAAFARLDHNAEGTFQIIGASVVSTWEVLLTDFARAITGKIPDAQARPLLDRISDALVPTQGPMQGAGKVYRRSIKKGVQHALQTGKLTDATAPIISALEGLPEEMADGWVKTADYLGPVYEALSDDGTIKDDFVRSSSDLRAMLVRCNDAYIEALRALPQAQDLDTALTESMDAWRLAVSRGMEMFLYDRRTTLVEAANRL